MRKHVKYLALFLAVVLLAIMTVGCGGSPAAEKEKPIEMTLAHADVPDVEQHIQGAAVAFKEYVEKESKGRIIVNISAGGSLGNAKSLQEQTQQGVIEACSSVSEGTLAILYPDIQVITVPYLFKTVDQAVGVLHGEVGQEMYEKMRTATGLRAISVWDNGGFRCFTNNVRPIKTPADLKGLKIRTMEIPAHMEMVKAMGGSPTPISWSELYSSLQTNVIQGQENPIPVIMLGSIQEVQKYLTLDNHVFTAEHILVNDKWFNALPQDLQKIVADGGKVAEQKGLEINAKQREQGLTLLAKSMEIYEPTNEELNKFKDACQDKVLKFIRESVSDKDLLEKILKAAENA